jgi:hypothetical protein
VDVDVRPALPRPGDILISNPSATVEHDISIVPEPPHVTCPNQTQAVTRARELARERQVDVWLTEDYRHFMKIITNRPA